VPEVAYAPGEVRYRSADADGDEVLRLAPGFELRQVAIDGAPAPGLAGAAIVPPGASSWTYDAATRVLRVHRRGGHEVVVR